MTSFKAPGSVALDHDFLWRCNIALPERGRIGIFNRSYYEDTLVVRVHKQLLENQKIPRQLLGDDLWNERFRDIRNYEKYLTHNGIVVRKFFLHVSKKEQKKRFLDRLEKPEKNWKFSANDIRERGYWDDYMKAFQVALAKCSTDYAPWFIIPANEKWFRNLAVSQIIVDALVSMDPKIPRPEEDLSGVVIPD